MNRERALQVEALDRDITDLQITLRELNNENAPRDLAQIDQKILLEKEIQQKRTELYVLLRGQPRPWFFHRLPSEILEQIFQWITDPSDQLKLLQTFPRLGPLMHWDEGTLYFKLVYPLIAQSLCEDWRDLWRLCKVSPDFMGVVLDHCKSEILRSNHIFPEYDYPDGSTDLVVECNELGRTEWMENTPFLGMITFRASLDLHEEHNDDEMELVNEFLNFLDTQGRRVWSCNIDLTCSGYSDNAVHKVIHDILGRMPCLVSLELDQQNEDDTRDLNVDLRVAYPWPNLPHLRWFEVFDTDSFRFSLIGCYGPQLQVLTTTLDAPAVTDHPEVRFSRLLEYYGFWPWSPNPFPQCLINSPLKIMELGITVPGRTREVLMCMSNFGNTLQDLTFSYETSPREWMEPLDMDAEFMTGISLPQLRRFDIIGKIRVLDGLQTLPSLRILCIFRDHDEASSGGIYLTKVDLHHCNTNIFQRLPKLEHIGITWVNGRSCDGSCYTRAKHEAHEKRLAQDEMKPRNLP